MINKKTFFLIVIFIILVALELFVFDSFKPKVKEQVTIEAGSEVTINDFLLDSCLKGDFVSDISALDLKKPGTYNIELKVSDRIFNSTLEIVDTIPPEATAVNLVSPIYREVEASEFVYNVTDATDITVEYIKKPDFTKTGVQQVELVLRDLCDNKKELSATIDIVNVRSSVQVEAGIVLNINAADFSLNDGVPLSFETDISTIDTKKPAVHIVNVLYGGKTVPVRIEVIDTTPPEANTINCEAWLNEPIEALTFITDINDASEVSAYFKSEPDFSSTGIRQVVIIIEDSFKNTTEKTAILTVKKDTEPPEIYGLNDKSVYIGKAVAYKKDVFVKDNKDSEVELHIDSSNVDITKEGTYSVTYTATDSSGNTSSKSIKVTVIKETVSEDALNELVDGILDEILTEDMTKEQQAYAIYTWIRGNIRYESHAGITDWIKEAHEGITTGFGDCFTYYIVSEVMLNRVNIDNMKVTRVGGSSNHYWNLVNCGSGWYHFDTCNFLDFKPTFMLTDDQVAALTQSRGINYYVFDMDSYPRTPTEEFNMDEVLE